MQRLTSILELDSSEELGGIENAFSLSVSDQFVERMSRMKPTHFSLKTAIRSNILALEPYRCARDDYDEGILLDANENALGHALPPSTESDNTEDRKPTHSNSQYAKLTRSSQSNPDSFDSLSLHRYPSPSHNDLKQLICNYRRVPSPANIFLGVGSDEVIDLLFRITCVPGQDKVLICPPTYGMYAVCAKINDVAVVRVNLNTEGGNFQAKVDEVSHFTHCYTLSA